ncbi:lactonase family protein [Pseudopedobacter saltans]|nr:lactonase family protein [Pseudopedobacter saltans]
MYHSLCSAKDKYFLVIGTYTKSQDKGIFVYEFDTKIGGLKFVSNTEQIKNPSFLTFNKKQDKIYSVGEENGGLVYSFDFDQTTGRLKLINQQRTNGVHPCYVTLSNDDKYLFAANYSSGNLSSFPIGEKGEIHKIDQLIQHLGKGIKPQQNSAHAHSIINIPNTDQFLSADLGADKIYRYLYNPQQKEILSPYPSQEYIELEKGVGPRHITFNQTGKIAYVINELEATVSVLVLNDDKFSEIQQIRMNSDDFSGVNGAADIHISKDGKFLYASNRGSANEIVIFSVDKKSGKLIRTGNQSTLGKAPRNFAIDPTDNFLLVANQNTNDVIVFKRDKKTGTLSDTGNKINIGSPVCLIFSKQQ